MSVQFPKVIDIDLDKSEFNEEGGNFFFKLDKMVEDRWKQCFRDAAQHENATCFSLKQPSVHADEWIVAYAEIDGEHNLTTVNYHVKHAVKVANEMLKEVVDAEVAEEAKKTAARQKLVQKVKGIVGALNFD